MKVSEKHQKSEKSKKNQTQTLSLNASKLFINQWEQIKQNKENDSEKIFIKKNENWYETVLHETKILQIEKINKLITCYDDECEEHQCMKKRNQYYSQKSWKYRSQNEENWSKKSLYKVFMKWWQWVKENHNHKEHEKIN